MAAFYEITLLDAFSKLMEELKNVPDTVHDSVEKKLGRLQ